LIEGLLIVAVFTAGFAMIAKRLARTVITAPMVFLALGFVLFHSELLPGEGVEHSLHLVAEIALVVLLFLDAAQIDLAVLRRNHAWPVRMLGLGLPLTILLGALAAYPFLPGWPLMAVVLIAAILAPTDAALGQAVVMNPVVPEKVRQGLTVESGLNDGLALPVILLFASLIADATSNDQTNWVLFGVKQLTLGPVVGIVAGLIGGKILLVAKSRDLTSETFEGVGALALAGAAYLGAAQIGGNGFIAAFVAGLCFGNVVKGQCKFVYEFTESEGQLLTWGAFLLLGLALVPEALSHLTPGMLGLILVSLFVVRPLAIWISLIGSGAAPLTRLFFGWFGPRGLATALFALLVVPQTNHELAEPILAIAVNAVWISALLHGLTAAPFARIYASKVQKMGACAETEKIESSAKPLITRENV
jgi:sodium/hydrogen antiporter